MFIEVNSAIFLFIVQ